MKEKPVKSALPDQSKVSGKSVVKNRETRKAIDEAIAGKGLSRVYSSIEEMFADLDEEDASWKLAQIMQERKRL